VACTDLLRGRGGGTKKGTIKEYVFVFILSFLGILRKYVDARMHYTSIKNREMMIILLNIIYFTKKTQ